MRYKLFGILGIAFIGLMLSGVYSAVSQAPVPTLDERIKAWHDAYFVSGEKFYIFPDGSLYKKGKFTGDYVAHVVQAVILWRCARPVRLDAKMDTNIYLQARQISFLEEGDKTAEYKSQCARDNRGTHPWERHVIAHR